MFWNPCFLNSAAWPSWVKRLEGIKNQGKTSKSQTWIKMFHEPICYKENKDMPESEVWYCLWNHVCLLYLINIAHFLSETLLLCLSLHMTSWDSYVFICLFMCICMRLANYTFLRLYVFCKVLLKSARHQGWAWRPDAQTARALKLSFLPKWC